MEKRKKNLDFREERGEEPRVHGTNNARKSEGAEHTTTKKGRRSEESNEEGEREKQKKETEQKKKEKKGKEKRD